ncbi:hypothetical protein Bbelb_061110 [Branchiostoma belcheri]|nr:hypothetical protein Bbelb_061110 [Branchiostoma belcheri]
MASSQRALPGYRHGTGDVRPPELGKTSTTLVRGESHPTRGQTRQTETYTDQFLGSRANMPPRKLYHDPPEFSLGTRLCPGSIQASSPAPGPTCPQEKYTTIVLC